MTQADFEKTLAMARNITERAPHAAEFVAVWSAHSPGPGGMALTGRTAVDLGWSFAAVRYTVEDQQRYMCAVTRESVVVNLPSAVAEVVYNIAAKWFSAQVGD